MAREESTLGFNTGYVEELYRQYLDDPDSVSESWREFFEDFSPSDSFAAATEARKTREAAAEPVTAPAPDQRGDGAVSEPEKPEEPPIDGEAKPIRGPAAAIAENMEASLHVPTATSVRTFPVKMMAENRRLINDYQRSVGGEKISYTHIIAWAVVKGLVAYPNMYTTFRRHDGQLEHVIPNRINLGLAIDVERRGRRALLVPNIKDAGSMTFPQFFGLYNDLVRRARDNELELSDFSGTTATITNPGMIGTSLSVPRLMQGQGVIVGVGAIGYPSEYVAFPPEIVSKSGLSEVISITSTYDHRVIQGAESGAFLAHVSELLLGHHGFYTRLFVELGIPYQPFSFKKDNTPQLGAGTVDSEREMVRKQARVLQLIRAYRVRAHLQADINPLGYEWIDHPELDPATYGLTVWDLDREFVTGGLGGKEILPLREILSILRDTYAGKIGVEYMHISDPGEKRWLEERIEPVRGKEPLSPAAKRRMLSKLNAAEAFEQFLHTKYIGHKRFSLEGAETVIPMLDAILSDAADQEVHEVVMGMAHRGRLNVLANILHKPYEVIFSEFEGSIDPNTMQGSGDVKYHLGATGEHVSENGGSLKLTLASNPSHLEAVNPVVEGMVRARQYRLRRESEVPGGDYKDAVIPLLIHGDAAFAGQGVVAETLNLSQLPGYHTGGTIHIVINNQIGFTTKPSDARSSTYATDIARMIQAPIIHVNGDDPEACIRVARLALDYRQVFNRDVVIDMLCYRVHGHNEADEPTYTQPILYKKIEAKRSVRKLYTEHLLRRGEMTPEEAEQMLDDYRSRLQEAFEATKELSERDAASSELLARKSEPEDDLSGIDTAVGKDRLDRIVSALTTFPDGLHAHKKLVRQFEKRSEAYFEDGRIDWSLGEALAYGSLVMEGTVVRLSGQDSRRGTFSHRHAVIVDQDDGREYVPLNNITEDQAHLLIYDSLLSEYAACGFEYGYSVADPDALVIWEAQFGDFANAAQVVFDQFLSAAEKKWGRSSSLVLLLPHGYEGQGPEHSSARLERFLQLCAEGNMFVCNFTTPANLFHAMRRQVKLDRKKPMVVMSPKSLLRHPAVVSHPEDFTDGHFQAVIPAEADDPDRVEQVVFCSGKVYFDLRQALSSDEKAAARTALVRIEQYYPFPSGPARQELERFKNAEAFVWAQEEPKNMGAWSFVAPRFDELLAPRTGRDCGSIVYRGRAASASPSSGSAKVHQYEQAKLVSEVLGIQ